MIPRSDGDSVLYCHCGRQAKHVVLGLGYCKKHVPRN